MLSNFRFRENLLAPESMIKIEDSRKARRVKERPLSDVSGLPAKSKFTGDEIPAPHEFVTRWDDELNSGKTRCSEDGTRCIKRGVWV